MAPSATPTTARGPAEAAQHDGDGDGDGDGDDIDFHHPFTPYNVQLDFMRAVYDVLEKGEGQVGILESPTGTVSLPPLPLPQCSSSSGGRDTLTATKGKSLSLICGALTWLRHHKRARYEASLSAVAAGMQGEPDWMVDNALRRKRDELARLWADREARLKLLRAREKALEDKAGGRGAKRQRVDDGETRGQVVVDEDREFLIADREADDDDDDDPLAGLSKETRALMDKVGLGSGRRKPGEGDDEVPAEDDEVKVCVCVLEEGSQCLVNGDDDDGLTYDACVLLHRSTTPPGRIPS